MTKVDIIIPILNEEHYIVLCLKSVLAFEKAPETSVTVYVVDGGSTDRTRELLSTMFTKHHNVRLLHNPGRIQSCAMNLALRQCTGDFVMRLDAHSFYPPDYLNLCLDTAIRTKADNVGGVVVTRVGAENYQARLVQAMTTHYFGVGNSGFRLSAEEGPADTVPFGFFKRSVFERVGYFDERLVRNQDYELNRRIAASGGRIWINPKILVYYHNQSSVWRFLKKQLIKEGPYNAYLWYLAPYARAVRHEITGAFSVGVIGGIISLFFNHVLGIVFLSVMAVYMILACISSFQQALRYKCVLHVVMLPPVFFAFHFIHGWGVLIGFCSLALGIAPVQRVREPWPSYGSYRVCPEDTDASGCRLL